MGKSVVHRLVESHVEPSPFPGVLTQEKQAKGFADPGKVLKGRKGVFHALSTSADSMKLLPGLL
jgi:hypothetical protein